ncbi:MAG: Uma2 family endonuclease [Armatimonadetes bacterium]|nr:Uma2 family endonuclease [Armatimonadota bacterium]
MPFTTTLPGIRAERTLLLPTGLLAFEELAQVFGEDENVELVDGTVVQRVATKDIHGDLQGLSPSALRGYGKLEGLGILCSLQAPVKITPHRCRLPDAVFVSESPSHLSRLRDFSALRCRLPNHWSSGDLADWTDERASPCVSQGRGDRKNR